MRRPASSLLSRLVPTSALVLALAAGLTGLTGASCATYRQDLARARAHYEANEYEKALALFRVLEPDMDSLSEAEKTQYAYFRGMTDYRLASLANPGGVTDPKREYRANARHWLAVSAAIDKQTPGGLTSEEKDRLGNALEDLNHDVLGGADAAPAASGTPKADAPSKPVEKSAADPEGPSKKPN
jgi:hypothetical protein